MRKKKVICEKQSRYKNQILTRDRSDLRLKQSRQKKATDYKKYTYIKTIPTTQIYLFMTVSFCQFLHPNKLEKLFKFFWKMYLRDWPQKG